MSKPILSIEDFLGVANETSVGKNMFVTGKVKKSTSGNTEVVTQKFIIMAVSKEEDIETGVPDVLLYLYDTYTNEIMVEKASNLFMNDISVTFSEETAMKQHKKMDSFLKYSRVLNDIESFQQEQSNELDNDFIESRMRREFSNIMVRG